MFCNLGPFVTYLKITPTGDFDNFLIEQKVSNRNTHHIYEYIY